MRYELPDRYLDIGAGRLRTIPVASRPSDVHYVGLDVCGEELRAATPGGI
jgi:hypothetical protein